MFNFHNILTWTERSLYIICPVIIIGAVIIARSI